MPPAYRNPTNDPPRLGEMIHYVGNGYECPGIVNETVKNGRFLVFLMCPRGADSLDLHVDMHDPTSDPARATWHFHHLSQ